MRQVGGSLLAGVVIGLVIRITGRSVSSRFGGAIIGAVAGVFLGLFAGHMLGGYHWRTTADATGRPVVTGAPIAPMGAGPVGLAVGAVLGALAERAVRGRLRPSE